MPLYYYCYPHQPFTATSDADAFRHVPPEIQHLHREDDTCDGTAIHRITRPSAPPPTPTHDH